MRLKGGGEGQLKEEALGCLMASIMHKITMKYSLVPNNAIYLQILDMKNKAYMSSLLIDMIFLHLYEVESRVCYFVEESRNV